MKEMLKISDKIEISLDYLLYEILVYTSLVEIKYNNRQYNCQVDEIPQNLIIFMESKADFIKHRSSSKFEILRIHFSLEIRSKKALALYEIYSGEIAGTIETKLNKKNDAEKK